MAKSTSLRRATPTHIKDLTSDPENRRSHNPRNIGQIVDSLHAVGAGRSIVIDEDDVILAGNGVTEAAAEAGITKLRVIEADGHELIAVRRRGLTPEQKRLLAMADNRAAELATWSIPQLQADLASGLDLAPFFTDEELKTLFQSVAEVKGGRTDPDAVPDERPTGIVAGDLFELGQHRLLCGDCTKAEDVERLMAGSRPAVVITDPPYNVGFDYGESVDDEKTSAAYRDWNRAWFGLARTLSASCVVLTSGITNLPMWIADIERTHRIIAWVKENQCSRNYIGATSGFNIWEPILVFGKAKKCVARDSFSIPIHIQADAAGHPCPKSIKAWSWLVENFSERHDLLYEPFVGSGTTLIACETLRRVCFGLDIEPKFVQLTLDRWEAFTGQQAKKVGEAVHA